jgi:transposase
MGAPKKADWHEERRKRAWALNHAGWLQKDIAVALGVSEGAVSQWMKRARERGGEKALTRQPPPGMIPRLSGEQQAQLPGLLVSGAEAYGFRGDVWTAKRVADLIWRHFGVCYHPDHVIRRNSIPLENGRLSASATLSIRSAWQTTPVCCDRV